MNDARKLLENIIVKLLDSHEKVRMKASRVLFKLIKMRNYEGFNAIQRRLSAEHQQLMHDVVNRQVLAHEDNKVTHRWGLHEHNLPPQVEGVIQGVP